MIELSDVPERIAGLDGVGDGCIARRDGVRWCIDRGSSR